MAEEKEKDKDKSNKSNMTPEERLFKIIATGGKETQLEGGDEDWDPSVQDPFLRFQTWLGKFQQSLSRNFEGFKPWWRRTQQNVHMPYGWLSFVQKVFYLKNINKGLILLMGCLTFYLAVDFIFGSNYRTTRAEAGNTAGLPVGEGRALKQPPDVSYYLNPAASRNIFLPPAPKEGGGTAPGAEEPPPVNIKLVGISWDEKEFVAMVEYEGEKGARFVRKGDSLQNGVKVEDIGEYSVKLSSNGKTWELN